MNTSNERIVMGIDPGYAILGYAVVAASGNDLSLLACGVITTPAGLVLPLRLQQIYQRLSALVDEYRPQEAAMEELFFGRNVTTAIAVGHARGVAMLALINGWYPYRRVQAERSEARGDGLRCCEEVAGWGDGASATASQNHSPTR